MLLYLIHPQLNSEFILLKFSPLIINKKKKILKKLYQKNPSFGLSDSLNKIKKENHQLKVFNILYMLLNNAQGFFIMFLIIHTYLIGLIKMIRLHHRLFLALWKLRRR